MQKNKKTVFNATFEESQNFVTKEYIERCFKKSDNDIIAKRTLGIFVVSVLLCLLAFFISIMETKSPYGNQMFASHLNFIWYGAAIFMPIYYVIELVRYKEKRILHAYLYTKTITIIIFFMGTLVYLFSINIVSILFGNKLVLIFYGIFYVCFIFNRIRKLKKIVYDSLYHQKNHNNKILNYYEKFEKFAKKYGFLVVLGLFIYRQFRGNQTGVKIDWMQQVGVILFPFFMCIGLVLIFAYFEDQLPGYYVNKYSEQYREKYGYSEFDWAEGNN